MSVKNDCAIDVENLLESAVVDKDLRNEARRGTIEMEKKELSLDMKSIRLCCICFKSFGVVRVIST